MSLIFSKLSNNQRLYLGICFPQKVDEFAGYFMSSNHSFAVYELVSVKANFPII
jgi:hypothetical protein